MSSEEVSEKSLEEEITLENAKFSESIKAEEDTLCALLSSAPRLGVNPQGRPYVLEIVAPLLNSRKGSRSLALYMRVADALKTAHDECPEDGKDPVFWKTLAKELIAVACKQLWPQETAEHIIEESVHEITLRGPDSVEEDFNDKGDAQITTKDVFNKLASVAVSFGCGVSSQ